MSRQGTASSNRSDNPSPMDFEATIRLMAKATDEGDPVFLPSRFWQALNEINWRSLAGDGYKTFKQTVPTNYFTWIVESGDINWPACIPRPPGRTGPTSWAYCSDQCRGLGFTLCTVFSISL